MITESSSKLRLDFFKELYETALAARSEELSRLDKYMEQYRGSLEIDGSGESATTVRNITYEIVESQVSSNIPHPKVDAACYSERRSRNSLAIERLLYSVRDKLPYEEMNDIDERYTYIFGGSVWYVEWDNTMRLGKEVGGVRLHCLSPMNFIPQPNISRVEDMEYCFLKLTTTRGELARSYGVSEDKLDLAEYELGDGSAADLDTALLTVAFYKDSDGEIGKFVFSGELTLFDMPKYYRRKVKVCKRCGRSEDECGCERKSFIDKDEIFETLSAEILLRDGIKILPASPVIKDGGLVEGVGGYLMESTKIPYYTPSSFPIVIRKNTSFGDALFGQSDCEYIRPEQQAINKIESRILQKLLRAGITPIMPEDASIALNNSVFGQIIKMKPGESASL